MLDHHENPQPGTETEELPRVELLRLARSLHVSDADVMTRAELRAAIDKARRPEPRPRTQPVTWVSVARRLLASIVEQGLHLPDAAALIRGDTTLSSPPKAPPPVATVTLARIYAAQGHLARAIGTLDEVLATDADHDMARELREQLARRVEDERNRAAASEPPARAKEADSAPPEAVAPALAEPTPAAPSEPAPAAPVAAPEAAAPRLDAAASPTPNGAAAPTPRASADTLAADTLAADTLAADTLAADTLAAVTLAGGSGAPSVRSEAPESIPATIEEPSPRPAELVIIETEGARAYVYWELSWPRPGAPSEPHWISVVTHTPNHFGSEREERRYPVLRDCGALRLEGIPKHAVVRAKLTRDSSPSSAPLVVAGSVRASSLELALEAEASMKNGTTKTRPLSRTPLEPRFRPHSKANPQVLAHRALDHLERASPAYW